MVTIGIIGTEFGAKVHLPGFRKVKNAKVLAIAGNDFSKTAAISREAKLPLVFKSWKELVACPEISAVSIATPPYLHAEMAAFAMKMGKHVLCEKPLAVSVSEAKKMAAFAKRYNVVNMIDFEFRNIPHWIHAKHLLQNGEIGKVGYVNIAWITGGKARSGIPLSWKNFTDKGGGTLLEFGSHIVDYVEWFFGPITEMLADLKTVKKQTSKARLAEDTINVLMRLKNGAIVNASASNVMRGGRGHAIEIYGSEGTLKLVNPNLKDSVYGFELFKEGLNAEDSRKITVPGDLSKHQNYKDGRLPIFIETAKKFVGAIQNKKKAGPSFADGLRVQRVIGAMKTSFRQGRWVKL